MTKLYQNVKLLCKENHISLRKLGDILGFPKGTISNWRKTLPSCKRVIAVAHYFGVSVDFLLGETDCREPNSINGNFNPIVSRVALAAERCEVDEDASIVLIKMMRALKEQYGK